MNADKQEPVLYFDNLRKWHEDLPHAPLVASPQAPVFMHGPRPGARRSRTSAPARGFLGILVILAACAAAICWNAKPEAKGAPQQKEIDLRASTPPPKFNNTSAEAPKLPAPPPKTDKQKIELAPQPLMPKLPADPFVPVPPPGPVPKKPPLEEPKLLMPVVFQGSGSLASSCFHDLQRGESPMKRHWNMIKVSSVVTAALVLTPLSAQAQVTTQDIKDLKNSIDMLTKTVNDNNSNVVNSLVGINGDLMKIQEKLKALGDTTDETKLKVQTMQGEMTLLDNKVKKLQSDLDKLKITDGGSSALDKVALAEIKARMEKLELMVASLEEGRVSKSLPANTGRILLANMYPETMLILINNVPYRVEPYTTKAIENQPPGLFKYEVISGTYGSVRTNQPTLEPGKTYTITVR